ncbi:MAG: hypothetical protein MZV64_21880 [Ignavibacteriales bacterium]|nr:hypothetical protein [Ignavibacteriales bacterium]
MEEDAGKSIHDQSSDTLVDVNQMRSSFDGNS